MFGEQRLHSNKLNQDYAKKIRIRMGPSNNRVDRDQKAKNKKLLSPSVFVNM